MTRRRSVLTAAAGVFVVIPGCFSNSSPRNSSSDGSISGDTTNSSNNQEEWREIDEGNEDSPAGQDEPASDAHREALIDAVQSLEPSRTYFDDLLTNHLTPSAVVGADLDQQYLREVLDQAIADVERAIEFHPEGYQPVHEALLSTIDYHAALFDYYRLCQAELSRVDSIDFYDTTDYSVHEEALEEAIERLETAPPELRKLRTIFNHIEVEELPSPRYFEQGDLWDHVPMVTFDWNYLINMYQYDLEFIEIHSDLQELDTDTPHSEFEQLSDDLRALSDQYESMAKSNVSPFIASYPERKSETAQCIAGQIGDGQHAALTEDCRKG